MKTNKEILTENRGLIISELTTTYSFQNVTLKQLMTDFMEYLETENIELYEADKAAQIFVLKNVIRYFSEDKDYGRNMGAVHSFTEQQRQISMNHFN